MTIISPMDENDGSSLTANPPIKEGVPTQNERVTLDKYAPPPLPWQQLPGFQPNYVLIDGLRFGWGEDQFTVERLGIVRTKTVLSEPLTEDGWGKIWTSTVERFPNLATGISSRVATESRKYDRLARQAELERRHQAEREGETLVASVEECVLLGGYGYGDDFVPGAECSLNFTDRGIWVPLQGSWIPQFERSYADTTNLEFSGPGAVKSGGGFIGGGFGLTNALNGMIVASVLNRLTTRTKIHTMIRYQARDIEAFFFHSLEAPDQLRIRLSGVLSRIRLDTYPGPSSAPTDRLGALERLAKLRQDGIVTDEEFAEMKRQILGES